MKDGTFKQGQAFVASAQQSGQTLQSTTVAQAVANAKQLASQAGQGKYTQLEVLT